MTPGALRLQIGARTLATIPRRLVRLGLSLDDVLTRRVPVLPPLGTGDDGYLVTSVPADVPVAAPGLIRSVRQRYRRYHIDLSAGEVAWRVRLSASARAGITRKARRLASASGGAVTIHRYRTAAELATFHAAARFLSARTYQARLMDAGLPEDFTAILTAAERDEARAWLLCVDEVAVAYLCCTASGATLRYDHVGHDPAFAALSPGAVLQATAIADLFADRFGRFDFTEGEGQHKRQFASAGTPCVDLLLLRPTLANRAAVLTLDGFDRGVAWGKRASGHPLLTRLAKTVRR